MLRFTDAWRIMQRDVTASKAAFREATPTDYLRFD